MSAFQLMCLTVDDPSRSHFEQVEALVAAGAEWIQLRAKAATDEELEPQVRDCVRLCRDAHCTFVVNDRAELAFKTGADGVHLGSRDMPWEAARRLGGSRFMIGGTVNSVDDARRVVDGGWVDYVGVGPFKFTPTKQNLAPVLMPEDWFAILGVLGDLPAYAIGGIEKEDLAAVQSLGIRGAAVCTALYRPPGVAENFRQLCNAL